MLKNGNLNSLVTKDWINASRLKNGYLNSLVTKEWIHASRSHVKHTIGHNFFLKVGKLIGSRFERKESKSLNV